MSDEHQEIVIIKRHANHEEGHHGGAWKIAFADFMTAMMALFLVLWLISSTAPKTKSDIAKYFNPVKLADLSPMRKGLKDPPHEDPRAPSGEKGAADSPEASKLDGKAAEAIAHPAAAGSVEKAPTHNEAALFRDPYAVLAEIAATGEAKEGGPGHESTAQNNSADVNEGFQDPFATIPKPKLRPHPEAASDTGSTAEMAMANPAPAAPAPKDASTKDASKDLSKDPAKQAMAALSAADIAAQARQNNAADAKKLQAEIARVVPKDAAAHNAPNVEVRATEEGVLISLTDETTYAMFAVGSAEPQSKTIQVMDNIAGLLKGRAGTIVIRGFTDARPYKSATYDNWRLSSARAQMAYYMLVRGGLDEKRIERIEGYADRRLKTPGEPFGAENRRIEILLRKDKS